MGGENRRKVNLFLGIRRRPSMMAEEEDEMRSMMGRLEGYLDGKRLEVNTEKTKVIRFRKGGRRQPKRLEVEKEKDLGGEGV